MPPNSFRVSEETLHEFVIRNQAEFEFRQFREDFVNSLTEQKANELELNSATLLLPYILENIATSDNRGSSIITRSEISSKT